MAASVRTEHHALVYDAGPAWGAGRTRGAESTTDSGLRVVLPYLRGEGLDGLDAVVISHDDSDHAGGAVSVLQGLPTAMVLSSLERDHPAQALAPVRLPCQAGHSWNWDGVRFSLLHPSALQYSDPGATTNDRSCVLRIDAGGGSALLAGDIGRLAEQAMLRWPHELRSDAILVPHHGSGASSSAAFVDAVAARHAIFSVGYLNRFGHPRPEVVERYVAAGGSIARTDRDGAVMLRLNSRGAAVETYRAAAPRYWHDTGAAP
jgi:competence protein ComEC